MNDAHGDCDGSGNGNDAKELMSIDYTFNRMHTHTHNFHRNSSLEQKRDPFIVFNTIVIMIKWMSIENPKTATQYTVYNAQQYND